jgi:hypothetical protein
MDNSLQLKKRLIANALNLCKNKSLTGIERPSAFLFDKIEMSFYDKTFNNIINNQEYLNRIGKIHPKVPTILEMQSSNSSDAILMNIFAHPEVKDWKPLRDLLSINSNDDIEFGWNPVHENEKWKKTEIDVKIGNSIFEAKLTETDFKSKHLNIVLRYVDVEKMIDLKALTKDEIVSNYQLIRNIVTAKKYGYKFHLLIDDSRTDLRNEFDKVKNSIIDKSLANSIELITWQQISTCVSDDLKEFLTEKYF